MSELQSTLLAYPGQAGVEVINSQVSEAPIDSLLVYEDRAEVKRRFEVQLTPGPNELIIQVCTRDPGP